MANLAVIGMHWGDEGKGKVVDLLADRFDVVARFQGGHNAGHTVAVGERRFAFHLVPSGILQPGVVGVIGNGVVLDPRALLDEVRGLAAAGVAIDGENLVVSDRAHVIAAWHRAYERELEEDQHIGTTLRGIGPAYMTKAERSGVRVVDLMSPGVLAPKVRAAVERANHRLRHHPWYEPLDAARLEDELLSLGEEIRPFVRDASLYLHGRMRDGASVLFEGAQATMLDVDHGTYPYVTSSSSSSGGICSGLGVGPGAVDAVLGVTKAYSTRVGGGPMPTELRDPTGELIRERGREYGASTGRPRRCGWFDAVAGRYAVRLNGIRMAALTLIDVLDVFDEIRVAVAYRTRDGRRLTEFPADTSLLDGAEPEYVVAKGWRTSLASVRDLDDLPGAARDYVRRLEDELAVTFAVLSVGSERRETIVREDLLGRWPRRD